MAPRDVPKATPKVQRNVQRSATKSLAKENKSSPSTAIKKKISAKKIIPKFPLKMNNTRVEARQRTNTVPKASTPPKDNKPMPPGSVVKSATKTSWKRRPKPAHSGVPVPEKMKTLVQKIFLNLDDSL